MNNVSGMTWNVKCNIAVSLKPSTADLEMSNFVLYSILNAPNTSHKFRVRVDGAYKCTYGGVTRRVKYSNFGLARTKNIGLVAENGKFYQVETDLYVGD